jgi:hypothetical protein
MAKEIPFAEILFKRLLNNLRPIFTSKGFRKHSQNFICESSECWGIINFQKSLYSSPNAKSFTVNVAIAAKRILKYCSLPETSPLPAYECHWRERIGSLLPAPMDTWWKLSEESTYSAVEVQVRDALLATAIPLIRENLTEQGLLDLWASRMPGSFPFPRYKHQSILLAQQGRLEELPEIFRLIRESCQAASAKKSAEEHISELIRCFPLIQ